MNKKTGAPVCFNLDNLVKNISNHKKLITLLLIGILIFFLGTSSGLIPLNPIGILNPGFEGGKATVYGATIYDPSYIGSNSLSLYQNAGSNRIIAYVGTNPVTSNNYYYWANTHSPTDVLIGHHYPYTWAGQTAERPQLGVMVGDIQLRGVDVHGDPTNYGTDEAQRINYLPKTLVPSTQDGNTTTYHYNVTETSILLVPAEFYISFYLVPSQQDTGSASSSWREGAYSNVQVWFRLDWNTWNNAYDDFWLENPTDNMFNSTYGGVIANQQQLSNFRGGFPMTAWIQSWQKAGYSSLPPSQAQGGLYTPDAQSATWYTMMGAQGPKTYTEEQLSQLQQTLLANVQFAPSRVAQPLSLFTNITQNWNYVDDPAAITETFSNYNDTDSVISLANAPSSGMTQIMYFPVDIANFGTYAQSLDWYGGSWNVYYPTACFNIRIIYGVYGTFTYLWTESVTNPTNATISPGLGYPNQTELPQTTVVHTQALSLPSIGFSWPDLFSPLNLEFLLILGAILILAVTVFNPGVWANLGRRNTNQKSKKGKKI